MLDLPSLEPDALRRAADRMLATMATDSIVAVTVVAIVMVVLMLLIWQRIGSERARRLGLLSRRAFNSAEGEFWRRLREAMPDHVVLMAVPLSRFISVRQGGRSARETKRLTGLTVDFALFRPDGTLSSVVLMEDSEPSLTRSQRRLRRKLLEASRTRSIVWRLDSPPSVATIRRGLDPDPEALVVAEPARARRPVADAVAA